VKTVGAALVLPPRNKCHHFGLHSSLVLQEHGRTLSSAPAGSSLCGIVPMRVTTALWNCKPFVYTEYIDWIYLRFWPDKGYRDLFRPGRGKIEGK
jgi:hypothetical protein